MYVSPKAFYCVVCSNVQHTFDTVPTPSASCFFSSTCPTLYTVRSKTSESWLSLPKGRTQPDAVTSSRPVVTGYCFPFHRTIIAFLGQFSASRGKKICKAKWLLLLSLNQVVPSTMNLIIKIFVKLRQQNQMITLIVML